MVVVIALLIFTGIIRTVVAEMVPQKVLQPRAFSIMPLVWTIGSILGSFRDIAIYGQSINSPKRSKFRRILHKAS